MSGFCHFSGINVEIFVAYLLWFMRNRRKSKKPGRFQFMLYGWVCRPTDFFRFQCQPAYKDFQCSCQISSRQVCVCGQENVYNRYHTDKWEDGHLYISPIENLMVLNNMRSLKLISRCCTYFDKINIRRIRRKNSKSVKTQTCIRQAPILLEISHLSICIYTFQPSLMAQFSFTNEKLVCYVSGFYAFETEIICFSYNGVNDDMRPNTSTLLV